MFSMFRFLMEDKSVVCRIIRLLILILTIYVRVIIYHFTQKKMRNDIHLYENPYWVSPIPSTGCSKVRSPDSFTELNVFDFTYPTNVLG